MADEMDLEKTERTGPEGWTGEDKVIEGLRQGEESAFVFLIDRYTTVMTRIALMYVADAATAEEIVQDTWIAVLEGIGRFEGRSSLKTWIFKILTNKAKTRGEQEARNLAFSAWETLDEADEPAVDAERFRSPDAPQWPGGWADPPKPWTSAPEAQVLSREIMWTLQQAIDALPDRQRTILVLNDIEGWASREVCNVFNLTETNQRVLLHRARSKVRQALECYFESERSR
jgi:RNA polymerase sigma-70 factor, ECF subfamily